MAEPTRTNCWEALACGHGPASADVCPAAADSTSNGFNGGVNAGRICWTVTGTRCLGQQQGSFVDKLDTCLSCGFFARVKAEQGGEFRLIKLGQGLRDAPELHATITRIESFVQTHEELHAEFDLRRLIDEIAREAQRSVSAERSVLFLLQGTPPELRGELPLRGRRVPVSIPFDDTSAVGRAAVRNEVVNVRDPYRKAASGDAAPAFNRDFDRQCNVRTRSLLAVPIRRSDGRPAGVITAANSEHGVFSADDQWFMEKYALQAGLVVEKARLLEDSLFVGRLASFGETLSGLSHCLKGITHALRGLSYIIRRAVESERWKDIEAACEILDRQVQRVVNLSLAVGAYDLERRGGPVSGDLNEIVADVVRTLQEEGNARAIDLEARLDGELQHCAHDRVLVYRCLLNLLCHVFDCCAPSGGQVTVATQRAGTQEAVIEVTHNGPGLDASSRAKLDVLLEEAHDGHGIGLPTAVHLIRENDGCLEVRPRPDGGTAYRVRLPLTGPGSAEDPRRP